jgi:hypothetical protein
MLNRSGDKKKVSRPPLKKRWPRKVGYHHALINIIIINPTGIRTDEEFEEFLRIPLEDTLKLLPKFAFLPLLFNC